MVMGNGGWTTVLNVEAIGVETRGNGGRDGYSGDDSFYRAGEMWGRRVEEGDCRLEVVAFMATVSEDEGKTGEGVVMVHRSYFGRGREAAWLSDRLRRAGSW
jgi:hypothetical protein